MSELGERLRRHVEGSSSAIDIKEIAAPNSRNRRWARPLVAAVAVVAVAGAAVVAGVRLSNDDHRVEVGNSVPVGHDEKSGSWAWLDFGPEAPDSPVPDGWQTLEHGPHRFSVPPGWVAPVGGRCQGAASGMVLIGVTEPDCDRQPWQPESTVILGDVEGFAATGPEVERIEATLTDAGHVRVLQDGPMADTSGWQRITYGGIEFRVPPSWPIADLPGTYETGTRDDGMTYAEGRLNPGQCGGAWFGSPEVYLGATPLVPSCPRPTRHDLRPGTGVWVRELDPSMDVHSTTTASGTVDGLTVEIIEMDVGEIADPLHVLITDDGRQTLLSIGVGLETPTARSILHSISASSVEDASTTIPVADCVDVDRFSKRMGDLGITYDYDPSNSPEHLADSAATVIRATLLAVRQESDTDNPGRYAVFTARVDDVEKGDMTIGDEVEFSVMFAPTSVPFSSIEEHFTPGLEVVLFLDAGPWPGGWAPLLEGLWAGCDGRAASMMAHPVNWSHSGSLDHLVERTGGPIEQAVEIDGAYRADDGTIVVTVTGYQWGYASCRGAYRATASTAEGELTITATETLAGDRSGSCEEVGYTHVLGVAGTAGIDANELVDAATGERVAIANGIDAIRPGFYRDRTQLPDCGFVDLSQPDDLTARAARQCFRDAYESGDDAELGVVEFGDEGESEVRLFRLGDSESYEVIVEQRPPAHESGRSDGVWRWQRYECETIHFLGPPEHQIENLPVLNYDGECLRIESS